MPITPNDNEKKLGRDSLQVLVETVAEVIPGLKAEVDAAWNSLLYRLNAIDSKEQRALAAISISLRLDGFIRDTHTEHKNQS